MGRVDRLGATITKQVGAVITKVDGGDGPGGFDAIVAVFDNVDSQGDVVRAGAFLDSIAARGDVPFPSLWAHQFQDETAIIASASAEEVDGGLAWHATFRGTPRAQDIRALMKDGLITEFSWSGRVTEGGWIDAEGEGPWGDGYYEIRKVDLWEAGPCFKGANGETELLGVKAAVDRLATKEGRVLAQQYVDSLKSIRDQLDDVIVSVDKAPDESAIEAAPEQPVDLTGEKTASPSGGVDPITLARLALS